MTEPVRLTPTDPSLMRMALSGATYGINFAKEVRMQLTIAIWHLNSCEKHGGVHHFAVTDEGTTLWCSATALECLNSAGLGFTLLGEEQTSV